MNEQRARENSAYVRRLLSEREPEFAAALAAAERYISWSLPLLLMANVHVLVGL